MDLQLARKNMIENQVRTWEVFDPAVLEVMDQIPRDLFVPAEYRSLAYADSPIPIGHGELMMTPKVEARMLQALSIEPTDRVLEIGTGTGYVTALLARLSTFVVSIDIREAFISHAGETLQSQHVTNISLRAADGARGYTTDGPYDIVAVTGAVATFDPQLLAMLAPGGRMFVIVGVAPVMDACLVTRHTASEWSRESLFETFIPHLVGSPQPDAFEF